MKQKQTNLRWLIVSLLLLTMGSAWGTTVTKTMTQIVSENSYTVSSGSTATCYTSFNLDANITVSTSGEANCGSFWGSTTQEWRLYQSKSGDVTITAATGYTLSSVTFTFSVSNSGVLKDGSTTVTSGSAISLSGNSKTFTVGNSGNATNGQVKITQISVTYESSSGSSTSTATVTFADVSKTLAVGDTYTNVATKSPSGLSVTYSSSDTGVATVDGSTGLVTAVAAGTATITASWAQQTISGTTYAAGSATYSITVGSSSGSTQDFTWDLSTNSYSSASNTEVVWNHTVATMTLIKNTSSTDTNNYLGGDKTSSRFYSNQQLTITPASGYTITKIEFTATTTNYASNLGNSTWTNASASVSSTTVTVTPTDGASNIVATIGGICGFTAVKVYYLQKTETTTTFPESAYTTSYPGSFSAPTATVSAEGSALSGATVTYESSNTSVATVNSSTGGVTIVAAGSTLITATYAGDDTYAGSTGSYTLTVNDVRTATNITFPQASYEAIVGESFTSPTATLTPSAAGSVTYSSSNTSVATVNASTGTVTIVAAGSAVITATYAGNSSYKPSTSTYTLTVSAASSSSTTGYQLYSGTLTEGDYVIYYNGSAMKATISNNRFSYETVTPVNDVITTTESSIIWHIARSGDYWTIYNNGVSKYAASTSNNNQGQLLSTTSDYALWTVNSTSSSTTYDFINKSNNRYLRNNVSGSNNYGFACYTNDTGGELSLYRYTSVETPTTVSAPTISPSSKTYWPATTGTAQIKVTISPASENSYVRYTTDGTEPTTSTGALITKETEVALTGTQTLKAIAYYNDDVKSSVVSETYTEGQTVNDIASFKALAEGTEARLYLDPSKNARVLHAQGNDIFLRDNTGAIDLYLNSSLRKTIPAHDQHVAGWIVGKYQPYNGLPELVATDNTTTVYLAFADMVSETETQPKEITAAQFDDNKADWVKVNNLRVSIATDTLATAITSDATELTLYNRKFGIGSDSHYTQDMAYSGALVDLTGIAIPYNTKKEIAPIYYNEARPLIYVLDETQDFTSPSSDISGATIRMERTFSNQYWNTLTLPFALNFDGTLREYDKLSSDGSVMEFKNATAVVPGTPYLMKPTESIAGGTYYDVTLSSEEAQVKEDNGYSYKGTYSPATLKTDGTEQFLKANGNLAYPTNASQSRMKGFRAYFIVPSGASVKVKVPELDEEEATGIKDTLHEGHITQDDETIYDMAGRKVGSLKDQRSMLNVAPGIYIVGGKKLLVK